MDSPSCSGLSDSSQSRDDSLDMSSSRGSQDQQPTHDMFGGIACVVTLYFVISLTFCRLELEHGNDGAFNASFHVQCYAGIHLWMLKNACRHT